MARLVCMSRSRSPSAGIAVPDAPVSNHCDKNSPPDTEPRIRLSRFRASLCRPWKFWGTAIDPLRAGPDRAVAVPAGIGRRRRQRGACRPRCRPGSGLGSSPVLVWRVGSGLPVSTDKVGLRSARGAATTPGRQAPRSTDSRAPRVMHTVAWMAVVRPNGRPITSRLARHANFRDGGKSG